MDGRGHKYQVGGDHENTGNIQSPVAETRSEARSRHERSDHIDINQRASDLVEQHPDANQKDTQYHHFPSFSEQARSLGLCRDHSLENPLEFTKTQPPSEAVQLDFTDPAGVSTAALLDMLRNTIAHEKWDVDRESANFLADVATIDKHPEDPWNVDGSQMSLRDLKIIEPVLTTDHELDMQRLGARNSVTISTNDIEPIPVDVERDEGLQWPSRYVCLPSELEANFASARLDIRKDVVDYLRDIAQPAFVNEREVMDSLLQIEKNALPKRITPPLLPLSPPLSPTGLPKTLQEMELMSEPEDLLALEAAEAEQRLVAADELLSQNRGTNVSAVDSSRSTNVDIASLYSGLETPVISSSSPERKTRPQRLKAEVPLLPTDALEPPSKKARTTTIPEEAHSLMPGPESDSLTVNAEATCQSSQTFLSSVAMPAAERAIRAVENEELEELDTVVRVDIPHVEVERPIPPWDIYSASGAPRPLDEQLALMALIKNEHLKHENHWSGVSKLERTVKWDVFPSRLGRVSLDEQFDDDESAERYMADLKYDDEIDIQGFVTKLHGPRLLDPRDDDEDELVPLKSDEEEGVDLQDTQEDPSGDQEEPEKGVKLDIARHAPTTATSAKTVQSGRDDLSSLLQRRKLEFEEVPNQPTREKEEPEPALSTTRMKVPHKAMKGGVLATLSRPSELLKEGGLEGFLRHQGSLSNTAQYSKVAEHPVIQHAVPEAVMVPPLHNARPPDDKFVQIPNPMIVDGAKSMQVIVTAQLLANRSLVRTVNNMLPSLEMVERCQLQQADDSDADISISPKSGLLITTLQKLKQRPLPGQKDFFSIHDRITAVSRRYEKLFVLISEGRPAETLDERDAEAIAGLLSFVAAQVGTEVEVKYVPGEMTNTCEWIAAIISAGNDAKDIKLLAEETTWERFLRVAGLNAFAAQTISAKLQTLGIEGQRDNSFGLAAFVSMSVEERVQIFGPVLGGDSVLRRASGIVDGMWSSVQLR
ncbi:hypothetical protein KC360_g4228 [Hortaea werneckii]|nr:hypothetical protein KC325_g4303 [Hortaea werneckii]KAI6993860.1 hypothetical protein KC359_g4932 [Hortaea werneckii]KAI7145794.1 hypothetical protein KC344_g4209 [Hortaea werneckii]KAI7174571.1 hypothetical protein KC360_g4228 [Hortaea werneckii]